MCYHYVCQVSLVAHIYFRPYDTITNYGQVCNSLETSSLLALAFTLNAGLVFGTKTMDFDLGLFELTLVYVVVVINILTMINFGIQLILTSSERGTRMIKKYGSKFFYNKKEKKLSSFVI